MTSPTLRPTGRPGWCARPDPRDVGRATGAGLVFGLLGGLVGLVMGAAFGGLLGLGIVLFALVSGGGW